VSDEQDITADRAVVDRIVDGRTAVLLVGTEETELQLPSALLPEGAGEGDWLVLDLATEPPSLVRVDEELTDARRTDLEQRMERIRRERGGGRFGR
jgi:hypothetical protein